jgi:hypothetical protein
MAVAVLMLLVATAVVVVSSPLPNLILTTLSM